MLSGSDRIRNLLGTYCELVDSADFGALGQLFGRGALGACANFGDSHGHRGGSPAGTLRPCPMPGRKPTTVR